MIFSKARFDLVKRLMDVFISLIGLIVLSPVLTIVALLVRLNLGSPVIFKQERPGKNGRLFTLFKFRTMLNIDEEKGLISNADRLTPFGKKLRSTSLDELPSLLNVLKGEMSIVGPRPLLVSYLEKYTPFQARRHEVRPGITGLAQVNGRNELDWDKRFNLDIEYVDNRSLLLDLRIIIQTLKVAITREGIVSEGNVVGSSFLTDERNAANGDVSRGNGQH